MAWSGLCSNTGFRKAGPLKAHGVAAEYLELPSGGHGLNHYSGPMWDAWQRKCPEWLAAQKIVPPAVITRPRAEGKGEEPGKGGK